MVTTRPEHEAAQDEYESFLAQSGLSRDDLQHIALEEVDFLDSFTAADVSGVLIGASPYNADTPTAEKTRSQQHVEEQIRELLAVVLKEGIPLLATGVALQVLAAYLGTGTQEEFGEELGAVDLFLTAEGREDPLLKGLPQAVTVFAGHYEGVGEVPAHATLLASSPDCPVQMLRVGRNVYACQFNPELDAVLVVFNASGQTLTQSLPELAGRDFRLSPIQSEGADEVVRRTGFDRASGTISVPARTVAVLVQPLSR